MHVSLLTNDMLSDLKQKTGFNLNNYIKEDGSLDVNKLEKDKTAQKIIGKENIYEGATEVKTRGQVQDELIKETIDKYNKKNSDKIDYQSVSQDEFTKVQQDTKEGLANASKNAFILKGKIYVNKDSKAYKDGTLFSTVGHEIMHSLEGTTTYYQMFNNVWNKMSKAEQNKELDKKAKEYEGRYKSKIDLKKEWFAEYIGENVLFNYKGFSKQIKKTNAFGRAIMRFRQNITVKSALEEKKSKNIKYENTDIRYQLQPNDEVEIAELSKPYTPDTSSTTKMAESLIELGKRFDRNILFTRLQREILGTSDLDKAKKLKGDLDKYKNSLTKDLNNIIDIRSKLMDLKTNDEAEFKKFNSRYNSTINPSNRDYRKKDTIEYARFTENKMNEAIKEAEQYIKTLGNNDFNVIKSKNDLNEMLDMQSRLIMTPSEEIDKEIMSIAGDIAKVSSQEEYDKISARIRGLKNVGKKVSEDLSGVTKAKAELTSKYNNVISQIKEKMSIDDLHTLLQRQSKEEIRSIKAKIKTRQDKIAEYEEKLKTETDEEKISNLKTGIEERKQQISKFELDIDVLEKKIDKIQEYSLEQSLDELKYIENKIKNVKSVDDIIAETLKEEGYSTLKEEIEADIKSLEDFVESVETKQTNKQEKILKDIYSSHESFIKKTYKSQSITNYEEFMKEYNKNLSSIKTQLKENGMTDEEIDNELKSFDTVLDIVKKHFDSYENLGKSFGKKRYNEVVKPLLNNIISIENLEVEDDVKSSTESIDRIDKVYNELISPKLESYKADFEKALAKKNTDKIAEIHNNIENIYQGLKKWLVPIYNKYSEYTEYHQEEYKAFESAVDDIGILAEEYDVNSPTVQEALKTEEVAEKVDKVIENNKKIAEKKVQLDTKSVEEKAKVIKPKKIIVEKEKIVYKPIKDGVRKKSVESAKSVKDWAQVNGKYYYELGAVNEMAKIVEEQAKELGVDFRFYFDESEGQEIAFAEVHKILNNYNNHYSKTPSVQAKMILDELVKGIEMKLPNANGEITWQKISTDEANMFDIEKQMMKLVKQSISSMITNSKNPTKLATVIASITETYKEKINSIIKKDTERYEALQKELNEVKSMIGNTTTFRTSNVGVDKKEINKLTKQISELREQIENIMAIPAQFVDTDVNKKYRDSIKALKQQLEVVKKEYKKAEKLAIKQSTKIAFFRSQAYGKVKLGFDFRKDLTSGLKDIFGKDFNIDNDVYIKTSAEIYKGHIDKATDIFFDYFNKLKVELNEGENILLEDIDDDDFKNQLKEMFKYTFENAEKSNIEKVKDKLKAKNQELKEKAKLQKETFNVANQILNKSETIENKLKKKGGVRPDIATQVQKLAQTFANISRNKIFNTDVRKAILDFDNYLNSNVDGQDIKVIDNLGLTMPQDLVEAIKYLRTFEGKPTVSLEEMKVYNKTISMISKFIDRANPTRDLTFSFFDTKTGKIVEQTKMAYEWAEDNIAKQKFYTKKLGKQLWFMNKFVDPRLVFQHLAGYDNTNIYSLLYEQLQQSQTKYEENYMKLQNVITKFANESKENKAFLKTFNKKIEIEGIKGTIGQFLSLYKLMRRGQGMKHLQNKLGGFTIDGNIYKFKDDAEIENFKSKIEKALNLTDKKSSAYKFIEMTNDFFEKAKELKLKTDNDLKGYSNVEEGEYFPIKISSLSKIQVLDNSNYFDPLSMQGARSYKFNENLTGTVGAMEIGDIFDIMNIHMKQISMYNAYSKTLDNFQSLYNLKLSENKALGIQSGDSLGLVTKMRFRTKGNSVYQLDSYLNTLFGDIQGISRFNTNSVENQINSILGKIRSKFASFQLGANLKVMASQLASIPASIKYIKGRYLIQAMATNKKLANMPELPVIAEYRKANKSIVYASTLSENIGKVGEALSKGIQFTDSRAINVLWKASLLQTRNADGSFNVDKATEIFTKAVRETQPNYSALDRSELLRSKNELVKALTMFTTQPAKNFTNFVEACSIIKTKRKLGEQITRQDLAYVKNSLTGLFVQGVVYSFMGVIAKMLLNGFRDDDKDDNEFLDFVGKFVNDNIIGMIPLANNFQINYDEDKKIFMPSFNDFEVGSLETLNDMISNLNSFVNGKFSVDKFVDTIGMATGIPTKNLYKYLTGFAKTARLDELETKFEIAYKNLGVNNKTEVNKALEQGNIKRAVTLYKKYVGNTFELSDESTNTMFDLYTKNKTLNTRQVPKTYTVDNTEYEIDTEMFKTTYGAVSNRINKLTLNYKFNRLNDDEKTYIINKMLTAYYNTALNEQTGYELKPIDIILTSRISEKNLVHLAKLNSLEATEKKTKKELVTAYLKKQQLTANEKYLLYYLAGYKLTDDKKKKVKTYLRTLGLNTKQLNKIFKED